MSPGYPPQLWSPRRWPAALVIATVSAAAGAAVSALITANTVARHQFSVGSHPTTTTVAITAPPSTQLSPLPTAQADRQTCIAWLVAGEKIHAAVQAQAIIPQNLTVVDKAVQGNPEWAAAVRKSADLYGQAGDTLEVGITPGNTLILKQAATSGAGALHMLSTAYGSFDPAGGNTYHVMHESADTMDVLCNRLAPR
ncbi:hypothetical protein [Mycobacterium sp.]|uniref:hypothetical protein n=1 Tax=Mycobacterium sp. TaxID=1785 RepID=UPI0025CDE520|nr:hypothetical protein [Mycobacterium sp.]